MNRENNSQCSPLEEIEWNQDICSIKLWQAGQVEPLTKKEIDKFVDENFDELLMKAEPNSKLDEAREFIQETIDIFN